MFYKKRVNACNNIEDLNIVIRKEFIRGYKDYHVYSSLIPVIILAGINCLYYILLYEIKIALLVFSVATLGHCLVMTLVYRILFGNILLEEYQWGNDSFEKLEMDTLEKMSDYELAQEYYNENIREQSDEYYEDTLAYGKRGRIFKYIFTLFVCIPLAVNIGYNIIKIL